MILIEFMLNYFCNFKMQNKDAFIFYKEIIELFILQLYVNTNVYI